MKLLIEEQQYRKIIQTLIETSSNRSLLSLRRVSGGAIFPQGAMLNNPERFRPFEREQFGIEEKDLETDWYHEDNSDDQM